MICRGHKDNRLKDIDHIVILPEFKSSIKYVQEGPLQQNITYQRRK